MNMDNYYTVIQIITGVNFVFILSNFLQRTINDLFDVKSHLDANNKRYANKWLLDAETANSMTIHDENGANNRAAIEKLSKKYKKIANIWSQWCGWLNGVNEKMSSRLGFQTLFLLGSIYCVVDLLLMAYSCNNSDLLGCTLFFLSWNIIFTIIILFVFIRIVIGGVKNEKEENLQWAFWFVFMGIMVLIVILFMSQDTITQMNSYIPVKLCEWNSKSAIILPFMPCALSVVYIFCVELLNKIVYRLVYWYCSLRAISPSKQIQKYKSIIASLEPADANAEYR